MWRPQTHFETSKPRQTTFPLRVNLQCSARRWLDLPGPGFVVIHRPAQMPRVQAPHYITYT